MSVAQLTATGSQSGNAIHLYRNTTDSPVTPIPYSRNMTMMCWGCFSGSFANQYNDLMGISDHGDVIGVTLFLSSPNSVASCGDNLNDWNSAFHVGAGEWHHYCLTTWETGGQAAYGRLYVDGYEVVNTDGLTGGGGSSNGLHNFVTPVDTNNTLNDGAPPTGAFFSYFNTRASFTTAPDYGGTFVGYIAAGKIWTHAALTPDEIRQEMQCYMAIREDDLWACLPMVDAGTRTSVYAGIVGADFNTQGASFTDGGPNPPGVIWDAPWLRSPSTQRAPLFSTFPDQGPVTDISPVLRM